MCPSEDTTIQARPCAGAESPRRHGADLSFNVSSDGGLQRWPRSASDSLTTRLAQLLGCEGCCASRSFSHTSLCRLELP